MSDRLAECLRRWLEDEGEAKVAIAREVIRRRADLARGKGFGNVDGPHAQGMERGMILALSYLCDRPGDISQTGAEGFISDVQYADELLGELEATAAKGQP